MDKNDFKRRTKKYAIEIARFCKQIPYDPVLRCYIDQLVRSAASVGANYRAACRAKSRADFINKMRIVEEECDESLYFLELMAEFYPDQKEIIRVLYKEGNELLSIVVASINTTIRNKSAI